MSASTKKKVFRIEQSFKKTLTAENVKAKDLTSANGDENHQEIMAVLHDLQDKLSHGVKVPDEVLQKTEEVPTTVQTEVVDDYKRQVVEATNLRRDLKELSDTIAQTKIEIASIRKDPLSDDKINSASLELNAVVADTEDATNRIIENAEAIETISERFRHMFDDQDGMVDDVGDHVVKIFEACNFQDITGQRITKVVNTMNFIDERITKMMDIWGGSEFFAGLAPEDDTNANGDVLHGPALPDARIDQDDIDALFD